MTTQKAANDTILTELRAVSSALQIHIAETKQYDAMTRDVHKSLITGNGMPSFQERVRVLEAWMLSNKIFMASIGSIVLADVVLRIWTLLYP